ncbi:MAG: hypothetical protein ACO1OF_11955 [Adhaeribacter sp.]
MDATENLELIDKYLRNELTGKELTLFEERIQKEPALFREVAQQRKIIQTIKEAEIRNILRNIRSEPLEAEVPDSRSDYFVRSIPLTKEPLVNGSIEFSEGLKKFSLRAPDDIKIIAIAYEGEPEPPFIISAQAGKFVFTSVKIYPGSGSQTFHYRFVHYGKEHTILHLYGSFKPQDLTLIYQKQNQQDQFKLKVKTKEYILKPNEFTGPLLEDNQT